MQNKQKHTNSPLFREHRNVSPVDHKVKVKKVKEAAGKYPRPSKEPTQQPKMNKHMASKSALETAEHMHYNSPTVPNTNTCPHRQTNAFTFTQLLQQNGQNNTSLISAPSMQQLKQCSSIQQFKDTKPKDKSMVRTPLTMANYSPNVVNFSQDQQLGQSDMEFSQLLKHKFSNINSQNKENDMSVQRSVAKSNPKSPIKVSNVHRLNNTPKIKEKKGKKAHQKQKQSKTFTQVISQELIPSQLCGREDEINLECSEKIFKFIKQSEEKGKKNKSNLLSTGIINTSQPCDNSESQGNRFSKDTLPSKIKIDRIISEENIKQFEQSSPKCSHQYPPTINEIKAKIQAFNTEILKQLKSYNQQHFLNELNGQFNPELAYSDTEGIIKQLQGISNQFRNYFQTLIKQISYASRKVQQDIDNYIDVLRDSKDSMFDWIKMEHFSEEKQRLESALCKNEIFSLKIEKIEKELSQKNSEDIHHNLSSISHDLTQQVQNIYAFLPSDPPEKHSLTVLPEKLKLKLSKFKQFLVSFQQLFSQ